MTLRITRTDHHFAPGSVKVEEHENLEWFMAVLEDSAKVGTKSGFKPRSKEPDGDPVPMIVPVAEWSVGYKADENIKAFSSVFVGDIDHSPKDVLKKMHAILVDAAISYGWATTHRHDPQEDGSGWRLRIFVELDREYAPEDHPRVFAAMQGMLDGMLDPQTKDLSHGYYYPRFPAERAGTFQCVYSPGTPLPVDDLLAMMPEVPKAPPQPVEISDGRIVPSSEVSDEIASWCRSTKDPVKQQTAKHARALLAGKNTIPLGKGLRNGFLTSLAGYLATRFPDGNPESVASPFETVGWDLLNADGKYEISALEKIIFRMQDAEREKFSAKKEKILEDRKKKILESTKGARDHEITQAEVDHLIEVFGESWQQHLFASLQDDLFALRPDGTYDPGALTRDQTMIAVRDRLAVFGDYVESTYIGEDGVEHVKTRAAILQAYASIARSVVHDMTAPRGGWDSKTDTITFAAAVPVVEPVYHADVAGWLATLDSHLTDAISVVPKHDRMLQAIVLIGPASAGKTLIANGIGQIYGSAPISGDVASAQFNSDMIRQPIIFMDERPSKAYKEEGTTLIRRFQTEYSRRLDEKFRARVRLDGFPRLIIAANNMDVLKTNEDMSQDDRDAFAERLLVIDMAVGKPYLDAFGKERIQAEWLDGRKLAQHFLWLARNHVIKNQGTRFDVEHVQSALHLDLAAQNGTAADVAYWILSYIAEPQKVERAHYPAKYDPDRGTVRICPKAVYQGWSMYMDQGRVPGAGEIAKAVRSLAHRGRQKITVAGKQLNAYDINVDLLRGANSRNLIVTGFDDLFPPNA
jgi:dephospho-CoA kinase